VLAEEAKVANPEPDSPEVADGQGDDEQRRTWR